jgi:adenine phosphoribosyltransferase
MSEVPGKLPPHVAEAALELIASKVRAIPDFPKAGILFRDITPILADHEALSAALDLHLDAVSDIADAVDKVVAIESRGFLFGMALAERIGAGFVPVRKPGKLPAETIQENYQLEYGMDALQIHQDALGDGDRVLIVDDLLATGGTAGATCRLVERLGGKVEACLFLIELAGLDGRERLDGRRVDALLRFD